MISAMVVVAALLGLATMILSTLNERRREMAILRSVGASPRTVVGLLMIEAGCSACSASCGRRLSISASCCATDRGAQYGLYLPIGPLSRGKWSCSS